MKKLSRKISLFIVLALLYIINPTDVLADDVGYSKSRLNDCVNNGTCLEMCGYNNIVSSEKVEGVTDGDINSIYIYYSYEHENFLIDVFDEAYDDTYVAQYGFSDFGFYLSYRGSEIATYNDESAEIWQLFDFSSPALQKLKSGGCPANAFVSDSGYVCFDNNSSDSEGYCGKKVSSGFLGLGKSRIYPGTSTLEFDYAEHINPWFDKWSYGDIVCPDEIMDLKNKEEFIAFVKDKYNQDFMNYTQMNKLPKFTLNILDSKFDAIYENNYQDFYNKCISDINTAAENGEISDEKAEDLKKVIEIDKEDHDDIIEDTEEEIIDDEPEIPEACAPEDRHCGLFCDGTWSIIETLYGIVKVIIPLVVIILGMIDFASVVFSGEDKDMKAAGQRFIKRIIIGVVLLLLPFILGFLFNLVGFSEGCLEDLMK